MKYQSIKVLYANTNISLDVMMGYDRAVERMMVSEGASLDYDYIDQNYSQVFAIFPEGEFLEPNEVCESLFNQLNTISTEDLKQKPNFLAKFLPNDKEYTERYFIGHTSMSVGDIIIIEAEGARRVYFCDNYGFKDITMDVYVASETKKAAKYMEKVVKENKQAV